MLLGKRQSNSGAINVEFGESVAADSFDYVLLESIKLRSLSFEEIHSFHLDFSKTNFIDPVSSQMIIALAKYVATKKMSLTLSLPRNKAVRDFWRAWGFELALKNATGSGLWNRVSPEERSKYFSRAETQDTYNERYFPPGRQASSDGKGENANFFGFYSFLKSEGAINARAVRGEKDHWKTAQISDLLKKKIGDNSKYLSTRIVFEAIFNAVKHPNATIIQTASLDTSVLRLLKENDADSKINKDQFVRHSKHFTLHFWDDGVSLQKTLSDALDDEIDVRSDVGEQFLTTYRVKHEDPFGKKLSEEKTLSSDIMLDRKTDPHLRLLATIFPHVTSTPSGEIHEAAEELVAIDSRLARRGMGLYVLADAVVNVLDGNLSIRCGRYFFNCKRNRLKEYRKDKDKFGHDLNVKVVESPNDGGEFHGNLIIVRVPIQK